MVAECQHDDFIMIQQWWNEDVRFIHKHNNEISKLNFTTPPSLEKCNVNFHTLYSITLHYFLTSKITQVGCIFYKNGKIK